jgi:hypothetical protein
MCAHRAPQVLSTITGRTHRSIQLHRTLLSRRVGNIDCAKMFYIHHESTVHDDQAPGSELERADLAAGPPDIRAATLVRPLRGLVHDPALPGMCLAAPVECSMMCASAPHQLGSPSALVGGRSEVCCHCCHSAVNNSERGARPKCASFWAKSRCHLAVLASTVRPDEPVSSSRGPDTAGRPLASIGAVFHGRKLAPRDPTPKQVREWYHSSTYLQEVQNFRKSPRPCPRAVGRPSAAAELTGLPAVSWRLAGSLDTPVRPSQQRGYSSVE